jgi:hypothetical protein
MESNQSETRNNSLFEKMDLYIILVFSLISGIYFTFVPISGSDFTELKPIFYTTLILSFFIGVLVAINTPARISFFERIVKCLAIVVGAILGMFLIFIFRTFLVPIAIAVVLISMINPSGEQHSVQEHKSNIRNLNFGYLCASLMALIVFLACPSFDKSGIHWQAIEKNIGPFMLGGMAYFPLITTLFCVFFPKKETATKYFSVIILLPPLVLWWNFILFAVEHNLNPAEGLPFYTVGFYLYFVFVLAAARIAICRSRQASLLVNAMAEEEARSKEGEHEEQPQPEVSEVSSAESNDDK